MDGHDEPIIQVLQLINVACGMTPEEALFHYNKTPVNLAL
jgi:succinate dehydrogenase / fumarate reductase cytochrome b subunit